MDITFDPPKRDITLSERGIDFETDAKKVFAGQTTTTVDKRFDYGEVRNSTFGYLEGRPVLMIWTRRGAARHIISMRFCHAKEARKFARFLKQEP